MTTLCKPGIHSVLPIFLQLNAFPLILPVSVQMDMPAASSELPTALGLNHRLYVQPRAQERGHHKQPLGIVAPSRDHYTKPSNVLDTIETCEVSVRYALAAQASALCNIGLASCGASLPTESCTAALFCSAVPLSPPGRQCLSIVSDVWCITAWVTAFQTPALAASKKPLHIPAER